jgi:formamidopyrimidine-DNA glycosylase
VAHLPEVEVMRKDLEREIVGKRIKDVEVMTAGLVSGHRNRPEFYKALQSRKVESIGRRGTRLVFDLDDGTSLVVRLGSQATLTRETANADPGEDTQLVATFTTGGALHYTDPDRDGELLVVPTDHLLAVEGLVPEGIDPLTDTFTWHSIGRQLAHRRTTLKTLLIDESFVVGLGDLYSDEILWTAGLSGKRMSDSLSAQEVRRLYRAILEVLHEAVKQGGTAETEFDEPAEDTGDFGDYVRVYGRAGLPCGRCRQPIAMTRLDRSTVMFHCPNCQT